MLPMILFYKRSDISTKIRLSIIYAKQIFIINSKIINKHKLLFIKLKLKKLPFSI